MDGGVTCTIRDNRNNPSANLTNLVSPGTRKYSESSENFKQFAKIHAKFNFSIIISKNIYNTERENNIKNCYGIIVPWYHDIVIFHPCFIENSENFNIFRQILIFFSQFQIKNDYLFAKIS